MIIPLLSNRSWYRFVLPDPAVLGVALSSGFNFYAHSLVINLSYHMHHSLSQKRNFNVPPLKTHDVIRTTRSTLYALSCTLYDTPSDKGRISESKSGKQAHHGCLPVLSFEVEHPL